LKIVLDDFTRASAGVGAELTTWVNGGVDAGVDVIADDGAELAAPCIDKLAMDHGSVIFPIVTKIRRRGACTEIDMLPEDGVADVGEVADVGVGKDQAVFNFHRLADVAVIAYAGISTDVAVWADFTIRANDDIPLDEDAGENTRAWADVNDPLDHRGWVNFTMDDIFTQRSDMALIYRK
jgi:hypothetical protein